MEALFLLIMLPPQKMNLDQNRNSPKHTRLRTSPALKTTRLQSSGSAMPTSSSFKHRIKEQEDYIRD